MSRQDFARAKLKALIARVLSAGLSDSLAAEVDRVVGAVGIIAARRNAADRSLDLTGSEFKVFSQWNEDGIIDRLVWSVPNIEPVFIEIGVEDYSECNTRFLALNRNWSGVAIDSGSRHVRFIAARELDWRAGISAVRAHVTAENINDIIGQAGLTGPIGLLSIDVDGQDYWLLQSLEAVRPTLLVVEYNAIFGAEHAITVPQRPDFDHRTAHSSGAYFGCSLPALVSLTKQRGYRFVGCESHGANAFFVLGDAAPSIPTVEIAEGFVRSTFKSLNSIDRQRGFASPSALLDQMRSMPVVSVPDMRESTIGAVFGL